MSRVDTQTPYLLRVFLIIVCVMLLVTAYKTVVLQSFNYYMSEEADEE